MRNIKKFVITAGVTAILTIAASFSAFAGQWVHASNGDWKYQHADGSFETDKWEWIDGNNDGIAECYYFLPNGHLVVSGKTPDGYTVNADGAWVENGVVQTKQVAAQAVANTTEEVDPGFSVGYPSEYYNQCAPLKGLWTSLQYVHEGNIMEAYGLADLYCDGTSIIVQVDDVVEQYPMVIDCSSMFNMEGINYYIDLGTDTLFSMTNVMGIDLLYVFDDLSKVSFVSFVRK